MDTTKNNGIVLATLIITMIVLSIILSITVTFTLKNPSLQQLLPGIKKRNIEKIYQEQLDARIQQEKFTGNEETDNNKVHQIIIEIVQQEHTIVGEIPKYTTGFEHEYTFTIQEKKKNIKTEITLKSKPELNSALQQVSMDSGYTKNPPLPEVGDTVIYDPTKGVTDTSKLTYTSYKGSARNGGNGYGTQTITAKSNQNEWIVISNANNQIKVMSKEPIGDVNGGNNNGFTLKGGIGWLYAEEELHKSCSIYGYGKGTKQITTTYQIGNKYTEEAQTRTLTNSGARSMSMEDIVHIMKGEVYTDFTEDEKKGFYLYYMHPIFKSGEKLYPTISSDNEEGVSTITRTFDNHYYSIYNDNRGYDKELIMDEKVNKNKVKLKNHIYKNQEYYLSSKCFTCDGFVGADIYTINDEIINTRRTLYSGTSGVGEYVTIFFERKLLRPVVYLDLNMVEKQSTGVWKIKD